MISKSLILILVAVVVVAGAGGAAYVIMSDNGSDDSGNDNGGEGSGGGTGGGQEGIILVENDNYSYWIEDYEGVRTTIRVTVMDVLDNGMYAVRTIEQTDGSQERITNKQTDSDGYTERMFVTDRLQAESWTRGDTVTLDKGTNYDGAECYLWEKVTSDHTYRAWIGTDDGVLYYYEDVWSIDGDVYTETCRLVTCTFIDKL